MRDELTLQISDG